MSTMTLPAASHIGVVDDDIDFAVMVADMCRTLGYRTTLHSSATALLNAGPVNNYSALVIDLSMPDMDGFELMRRLAAAPFGGPVVLMSGFDLPVLKAAQQAGKGLGVDVLGLLKKPFRFAELSTLLTSDPANRRPPSQAAADISVEELERAIYDDALEVHMHPQVALHDGRWTGMEALVRWRHPTRGMVTPDRFVPLAETSGLALAMTRNVTQRALRISRLAEAQCGFAGTISINIAPASLTDEQFPEVMDSLVRMAGWSQRQVCLEVTETSVAANRAQALEILARLRLKGFTLSIDDFGTGHSSLENLSEMPVSELKIDMNFVRPALNDKTAHVIVENCLRLGHQLGMTVVAEGVESAGHWHWLRGIGCDVAQGYMVAKPRPPEELAHWSREWMSMNPARSESSDISIAATAHGR